MKGTLRFFRMTTVAAMLACASCCSAGHYVPSTKNSAGQPKNPSGGLVHFSGGQFFAYASGASGYGGEQFDSQYVECEGEIATLFEWVRDKIPNPNPVVGGFIDDPLDDPPAQVISAEYCIVSFSAFTFDDSGVGTCTNGLGFAPDYAHFIIGGGESYLVTGVSEGTLYTKRDGGQTIEITRTPLAYAAGYGFIQASVWYTSTILNPKVSLAGTSRFYDPPALKFLTGQRISASVVPIAGLTIDSTTYQWSFDSGDVDEFKDYTYGSVGERKELQAADKKQSSFNFYTNKGATTKVLCDFKYKLPVEYPEKYKWAGGLPDFRAESKEVESVRPEFVKWDVKDGTVALQTISNRFIFEGDGDSTNGQQWKNVEYNVPGGFGQVGEGCFCQLISADRNLYRTVTSQGTQQGAYTHFVKNPWNAQQTLDMGLPYPFGVVWSVANLGTGVDSPTQPLTYSAQYTNYWYKSTASDTFETWAMYRPPAKDGQPTTWIPMAHYTWAWEGEANLNLVQNLWVLSGASGGQPGGAAAVPDPWDVHPTWNKVSPSPFGFIGVPPPPP